MTSLANGAGGIVDDVEDPRVQSQEEHDVSKLVD